MFGKQLESPDSDAPEVIAQVRPCEGRITVPTSQMKNWALRAAIT